MGKDLKVQLGARVPGEVRELAVAAAKKRDISLNEWVERALLHYVEKDEVAALPVRVDESVPPGTVEVRKDDQVVATITNVSTVSARPFRNDCRQATLHWKYGPGRPCRYCEGEVYA